MGAGAGEEWRSGKKGGELDKKGRKTKQKGNKWGEKRSWGREVTKP
jgi:hypothetical protein